MPSLSPTMLAGGTPKGEPPHSIYIIRHAEKPKERGNRDLSREGRSHAESLATALPKQLGTLDFLFAAANSRNSKRPLETLKPLAAGLHLSINEDFPASAYATLAAEILDDEKYSRRRVLVCWRHEYIPRLAQKLLARNVPHKWPSIDFTSIWMLRYESNVSAELTEMRQNV
jgi:phosphohistidine phosphatase SixA